MKNIIFLSGFGVPNWLAKSKLVWDDGFWYDCCRTYIASKTPRSDNMVKREIDNLCKFINQFHQPIVIGQSLGAWWAANLASHKLSNIHKLILWTPVGDASYFPIFNVTKKHHPIYKSINQHNVGPHKTLIVYANNDWLTPFELHSSQLIRKFDASSFELNGGHWFQDNHYQALEYIREWIELG